MREFLRERRSDGEMERKPGVPSLIRSFARSLRPRGGGRAAFFFFAALLSAAATQAAPRAKFDERIFDFGVLIQGATAQHSFGLKNTGKDVLHIESVSSSCGCTAALPAERDVPPGGRSRIDVTYDSRGKMGEIHKVVRVKTNDPEEPVQHLTVKGLVVPSEHPDMTGAQNLLQDANCRTCHVDRGAGKMGQDLYLASCAMCHENHKRGGHRIAAAADEMSVLDERSLRSGIADGREGTSMPAYHKSKGGPLSDKEIKSLVRYIKSVKTTSSPR
jgi:cytochrome c553